jgi:hypothetical protein
MAELSRLIEKIINRGQVLELLDQLIEGSDISCLSVSIFTPFLLLSITVTGNLKPKKVD